jgi:GT2 family glycosyltransferase
LNTHGNSTLFDIHTLHQGKVSDKWERYLYEYDSVLSTYRNKNINLLEIGIQNGGSLEVWSKYFNNANLLIGCDIDMNCLNLQYEEPCIKVVVGDATQEKTKKEVFNYTNEFDIVIEDASHFSNHIIKAFVDFFPKIKDGGIFIAEDLHCSYWKDWEGGLYDPYSSLSFFKLLVDIINFEHWGVNKKRISILEGFSKKYNINFNLELLSHIHSVEFINSMCIIKKRIPKDNDIGQRYITGTIADVCNSPLSVTDTSIWIPSQNENFYSTLETDPREKYIILLEQIQEKESQIQEKESQIQEKESQIQNKNNEITHLHHVAQSLRLKNRLKRIVKIFIPNKLWKILRYIKQNPNPNAIKLGLYILKTQGIKALLNKVNKVESLSEDRIENTYTYIEPKYSTEVEQTINEFKKKPLISIIMPVYNVDPKWLELAIESIESQWYENWELCIVDDKSTNQKTLNYLKKIKNKKINIKFLKNNLNISGASNEALTLTGGDYVALMDNDDELTPDALYEVVKAINDFGAEFIYSDEDKLEMNGTFSEPHFKPDFAPDMFLSQNYLSHLGVIKKELIDKVNGFTIGLEGAQDYDLYLKVLEHTNKISHISKVLYHWRKIPGSTAAEFSEKSYAQDAGVKSLENAFNRRNISAKAINGKYPGTYRVKYEILDNPLVSIIIPFKDKPELLTICIESILDKSTYKNFEVIGISNNSQEKETFDEMKRLELLDSRIKFYEYNVPFNYSDINNYAVNTYAKGKQILLLNNDIEIITPDWIESMLEHSQRDEVGVVGAKLYYPNDTIQHAGVIIGIGGVAGHSHKNFSKHDAGYFSRLDLIQNLSAVTAACLMVKKRIYEEVIGLNEDNLKIAFNDVDFCLRIREKGYLNIYTPYSEAYHHESISRGKEDSSEKIRRFNFEVKYMKTRHQDILEKGDPYYHRNLTLNREDFSLI